jgi:hypothetical protein
MSRLQSLLRVLGTAGAQAVPLGGVLGLGWGTVTGMALYWVESLLLVFATGILAILLRRETAAVPGEGGDARAARGRRRDEANRWKVRPKEVFEFHLLSLLIFGGAMAGTGYAVTKGGILAEFDLVEFQRGVLALTLCVGLAMAVDAWRIATVPVASVGRRVKQLTSRWVLFWALGFFGPLLTWILDEPRAVFGLFGGLKAWWEVTGALERWAPGLTGSTEPPRSVYEQRKVTLAGASSPDEPA